jgi:hypothetical protein
MLTSPTANALVQIIVGNYIREYRRGNVVATVATVRRMKSSKGRLIRQDWKRKKKYRAIKVTRKKTMKDRVIDTTL